VPETFAAAVVEAPAPVVAVGLLLLDPHAAATVATITAGMAKRIKREVIMVRFGSLVVGTAPGAAQGTRTVPTLLGPPMDGR